MRTARLSFFAVAAVAVAAVAAAAGPAILTAPLGVVNGGLEVEVDLGGSTGPATLYLDGVEACAPTENASSCRVDLGPALHVHLLELVVTGTDGGVQRVERWLNRPGYEADLEIELASRPIGNVCGGRLNWFDVHGQQPADLEADAAGERMAVSPDTRTFGYPCAEVGSTEVVTAEVVFDDGRRAAAVVLTAESGRSAGGEPQLMVLEAKSSGADPCAAAIGAVTGALPGAELQGFEVAFVLDPTVNFAALAGLGGGGMTSAWDLATTALSDADRLWYVRPDSSVERLDGFADGRETWLGGFFQVASSPAAAELRLADAVATAGLTAGAAPRRRAVVLVLGSGQAADTSRYSVEQVRSFLAEIGVPLQVIRTEQARSDGWPTGVEASSLDGFAVALEGVRDRIDTQCVAWFPALLEQRQVAALLPRGVAVAGRSDGGSGGEQVWRRAALTGTASASQATSGE
ncbi:MAG: hypothetical protein MUP13_01900, partial [Thermoanaerobaculales bacterium]|nr:hypothetical protein [Thermoanaerobaculales bacterium]